MAKSNFRTEKDSLGSIKVPSKAYSGAFSARSSHNFQISGVRSPKAFEKALGIVKLAAAQSNIQLKLIPKKYEKALTQACKEFIDGKFSEEFNQDVFQAGAGTGYNMNSNEIIANRANELLKGKKGEYKYIDPNNQVNMAQSTNDVIPTATRIGTLLLLPDLLAAIQNLEKTLQDIAQKHKNTLKVGRTHLQDAVPITFGQEFDSFKQSLINSRQFITRTSQELRVLGIGGTAVGTGINTDPKYKQLMLKNLRKITKISFKSAKNLTEIANNMNAFLNFSASLRSLAVNLTNLSTNLKLMNMGPKAGISEIDLPAVQPGSSIMPGKINPSIPECLDMICYQVLGNDKTIELSAQKSHFELNVMCPIIMYNLFQSMEILTNGLNMLNDHALKNLKINKERSKDLYENSLCTATALNPYLGYQKTSEIVKNSLKKGTTIKEEVLKQELLSPKELEKILSPESTTKPKRI